MNRNSTRPAQKLLCLQNRLPESEKYRTERPPFCVVYFFNDFGFHFVLCLQTRLPKSEKYREERPPCFLILFMVWGFILYSAYRNGSRKVTNTGRSARHFFDFLTMLGLILAHFGSLLQLCWPPWTSFGQPWGPCGQKVPVPVFFSPSWPPSR